jgi:hypothetical protein
VRVRSALQQPDSSGLTNLAPSPSIHSRGSTGTAPSSWRPQRRSLQRSTATPRWPSSAASAPGEAMALGGWLGRRKQAGGWPGHACVCGGGLWAEAGPGNRACGATHASLYVTRRARARAVTLLVTTTESWGTTWRATTCSSTCRPASPVRRPHRGPTPRRARHGGGGRRRPLERSAGCGGATWWPPVVQATPWPRQHGHAAWAPAPAVQVHASIGNQQACAGGGDATATHGVVGTRSPMPRDTNARRIVGVLAVNYLLSDAQTSCCQFTAGQLFQWSL